MRMGAEDGDTEAVSVHVVTAPSMFQAAICELGFSSIIKLYFFRFAETLYWAVGEVMSHFCNENQKKFVMTFLTTQ